MNKNEKQQDAKNNAELFIKKTKTAWKTFEEAKTGLSRPNLWRMMMMMMMMIFPLMKRMMKVGHELQLKKRYYKNICEFHTDLDDW